MNNKYDDFFTVVGACVQEPETVLMFSDHTYMKAVARDGDEFDPLMGVLICAMRRLGVNRISVDAWYDDLKYVADHISEPIECELLGNALLMAGVAMRHRGFEKVFCEYRRKRAEKVAEELKKKADEVNSDSVWKVADGVVAVSGGTQSVAEAIELLKRDQEMLRQEIRNLRDEGEL